MLKQFKKGISILLVLAFTFANVPSYALADEVKDGSSKESEVTEVEKETSSAKEEKEFIKEESNELEEENLSEEESEREPLMVMAEDGSIEVSTWEQFRTAYNDNSVKSVKLTENITYTTGALGNRTSSFKISGKGEGENFLLDLKGQALLLGAATEAPSTIRLEDLNIANTAGAYVYNNQVNWAVHAKNIKTVSTNAYAFDIARLVRNYHADLTLEGEINLVTSNEAAIVRNIEMLDGINFKLFQAAGTDSAFWYESAYNLGSRYFRVGDNATINMSRTYNSGYPPVFDNWTEMTIGNNVNWYQDNYQKFVADQRFTSNQNRTVMFGKRGKIEAVNSSSQSIHFSGTGKNYIEFGPGSSMKVQGTGNIIELSSSSSVKFRNPVGLDLESKTGRIFNLAGSGNVEFQYMTMSTWNYGAGVSTEGPASAEFAKVTNAVLQGGGTASIATVTSDNKDLVSHFKSNNSKRILTEKIPIGGVAVGYVNQFGDVVGETQVIDIPDKEAYVIDEEVIIPDALRTNPAIPADHHYATPEELAIMEKTQPEYAFTGMEGVNDPRITKIYVHSDKTEFTVNFINSSTEKNVGTSTFNKFIGESVNLKDTEFTTNIPAGLQYAEDTDLKEGQVQTSTIKVEKNGAYTVYVTESAELKKAKDDAKKEIEQAAEDKLAEIDGLEGVSDEEKAKAKDEVNKAKDEGLTAVDNAPSIEDVTVEKDKAIENINKVTPETEAEKLQKAKDDAKKEIDKAAEDKKEAINNDTSLSDKAKEDAIAKVEEEREKGNTAVDNADSIAKVEEEKNTAIENINKVTPKTPAEELQEAKDDAKKEIEQAAEDKLAEIDGLEGVSDEEKAKAKDEVNKAKDEGLTAVDNAPSIEDVTVEKDKAIENINKVTPETEAEKLQKAKDDAKKEIEQAAEDKLAEIDGLEGVSDEEKAKAKDEVNKAKDEGLTAVDNAPSIEDVTVEKDKAIENINKVTPETEAEKLQKAKDDAKKEIEQAAEDKLAEIDGLEGVSDEEKAKAKDEVNKAKDEGLTAVDNAPSIEDVTVEKDKAIENINKVTPETEAEKLQKAKDDAKKEIEQAAEDKLAEIDGLEGVSDEEKAKAKDEVNKAKDEGLTAVDNAPSIEDVTVEKDKAIENINKVTPETEAEKLQKAKDDAKKEIDKAAEDKKEAINNDTSLSDKAKEDAIAKVEEEREKGNTAVDNADSIAKVEEEKNTAIENINKVTPKTPAEELQEAKDDAKKEIEQAAEDKLAEIDGLEGVSDEEKAKAKDEVNKAKDEGLTAVDNAPSIEDVTVEKDKAIENINKVTPETEAEKLQKAKDNAKKEIDKAAEDKKEAINNDTSLSDKAKEDAIAKVEEEREKGNTAVDNADSIAKVEEEKNTAIENINKVTPKTPAEELQEAKDDAKKEIDKAAEDKKEAINNDTSLSDKAKEDAIAKVEEEREKGNTAVDNADSIAKVEEEKNTAIENINKVTPKTPAEELQEAKDDAKKEIDKAAEDKKEAINNDTSLSDKAKEDAIAKVEEEREKGNTAVDNADSIAKVEEEKNTAIENINKVTPKTPAEELQEAKDDAKKEIDKAAEDKKEAINNDTSLSDKAKEDAIAKVEEEREKGNTAVDNADSIAKVEEEKNTAIENINKVTPKTPAEELQEAKDDAKKEIEQAAEDKLAEIDGLEGVSDEEKAKAKDEVNKAKDDALNAIDKSTNIEDLEKEKNIGIENINKIELKPGDPGNGGEDPNEKNPTNPTGNKPGGSNNGSNLPSMGLSDSNILITFSGLLLLIGGLCIFRKRKVK